MDTNIRGATLVPSPACTVALLQTPTATPPHRRRTARAPRTASRRHAREPSRLQALRRRPRPPPTRQRYRPSPTRKPRDGANPNPPVRTGATSAHSRPERHNPDKRSHETSARHHRHPSPPHPASRSAPASRSCSSPPLPRAPCGASIHRVVHWLDRRFCVTSARI